MCHQGLLEKCLKLTENKKKSHWMFKEIVENMTTTVM